MMRVKNHHIPATIRVEIALSVERSMRGERRRELTWVRYPSPAASESPSCARSSCGESTHSPVPRVHPHKDEGSPTQMESV